MALINKPFIWFVLLSLLFHFVCEYLQLPLYTILFVDWPRVAVAALAAVADTFAFVCIFLVSAFLLKNARRGRETLFTTSFVLLTFMTIVTAEYIGIHSGMWSYGEYHVVIPGLEVSLVPIIYFLVTALLILQLPVSKQVKAVA